MSDSDERTRAQIAPWRALLEAHSVVIDRLAGELEAEAGLPLGWYGVLLHLRESPTGRLRMHELADSLLLSRSAVTRFVDRMEDAGLVERRVCPTDGRGLEIAMTDSGRRTFRKAGRIHLRGIKEHFLAHISDAEAEMLVRTLRRVAAAVKATPGDAAA